MSRRFTPPFGRPVSGFLCAATLVLACSRQGVRMQSLPDGSRELRCDHALWKCLLHVDDYCKGASFDVLRATDNQLLYGSPGSEVESRTSKAIIRCRGPHSRPLEPAAEAALPATGPAPALATSAVAKPPRACVPGATQVCVGPGACSGGQACLPDGSGFGNCDCGGLKPAASSEAVE